MSTHDLPNRLNQKLEGCDRMAAGSSLSALSQRLEGCDTCVKSVVEKFVSRAEVGRAKYGTTLDRTDLTVQEWITHAQEEFMDGILYLEKLRRTMDAVKLVVQGL